MTTPLESTLLLGADGGATEIKVHAVACDERGRFALRPESASRLYEPCEDFTPVPLDEQLAQHATRAIQLTGAERRQADQWISAAVEAIVEVARRCGGSRVCLGIGMPGLKTPDRRGIAVINNGPRIPDYLDRLEAALAARGVALAGPVSELGSDADYCGLGEQYAADGLLRDVEHAYYVGCGTGIADALKLRGELVPFDEAKDWLMKAWQIPSSLGPTFEKLVSAKSLNEVYANLLAGRGRSAPGFPEQAAAAGEPLARGWMGTAALVLAELIFERISTIRDGRQATAARGPAYARLRVDHPYRGILLERVVIGQRLGLIYAEPVYREVFADRLEAYLAALVATLGDEQMQAALLVAPRRLRPGFLAASRLRAAPALGAAVAAAHAAGG